MSKPQFQDIIPPNRRSIKHIPIPPREPEPYYEPQPEPRPQPRVIPPRDTESA
jgi:hypothetical protein